MTQNELLIHGAAIGDKKVCILARDQGATDFSLMLKFGAYNGYREICELAREWMLAANQDPTSDIDMMLKCGAYNGHREICGLACEWGAMSELALVGAAAGGQLKLCEMIMCHSLAEFPTTLINRAMNEAACNGHSQVCEILYTHEHSLADPMLCGAARGGHRAICERARELGARNFIMMLIVGAVANNGEICELAREWGSIDESTLMRKEEPGSETVGYMMLRASVTSGNRAIFDLARKWFPNTDISAVLAGAVDECHRNLVNEWLSESQA